MSKTAKPQFKAPANPGDEAASTWNPASKGDGTVTREPQVKPYSWTTEAAGDVLIPAHHFNRLVDHTADIAGGVAALLELLEANDLREPFGEQPIVDAHDRSSLMRLAIASTSLLFQHATEAASAVNNAIAPHHDTRGAT